MTRTSNQPLTSLRVRLAVLVLIVVAPIVALVLVTHVQHRREEIEHGRMHALQVVGLASEHHARLVEGARQMLGALARTPEVRDGDLRACDATIAEILAANPCYGSVTVINPQGDIVSPSAAAARGLNVRDFAWYQRVRGAPGFAVGGYHWGRITKDWVLVCTLPRRDESGADRGLLTASLRTDWVERFARVGSLPAGSTLAVVGRDGIVWARYPDGPQWVGKTLPESPVVRGAAGAGGRAGVMEIVDAEGVAQICAVAPLNVSSPVNENSGGGGGGSGGGTRADSGYPGYVMLSFPRDAAVAPVNRRAAAELGALGVVTVFMLLIAGIGSRVWIFCWFDRLAAATRRVAAGELSARAQLAGGPAELRRLGQAFDDMAAALEQSAARRAVAEADLRRSETHLRNVLNNLFAFVTVLTPDGVLLEVNEAALRAVDVEAQDVIGRPFEQTPWWANSEQERSRLREAIARAARGDGSRYDASPRVDANGRPIFVDTMVAPMFDDQRRVTHIVVSGIDVTVKRHAERALRESEERLSLAVRTAGLGTWDADLESGNSLWSAQTFRLLGYEPRADGVANNEMWRCRIHPDDLQRVTHCAETAVYEGSLYNPEYRVVCPQAAATTTNGDGGHDDRDDDRCGVRWIATTGRVVFDGARPVRFVGVMQDITARKRAEEEIARLNQDLQRRVQELQTLLEVIPVGIGIAQDPACTRVDANAAFGRVLGLSSGDNASLTAPPGERPAHFTCWRGGRRVPPEELPLQVAAQTGRVVRDVELEVRHADGRVVHLLEYAAPLLDHRGAVRGSVGAFIDISERKRADADRQALMEQANAERLKLEAVLRQMPAGVVIAEASPTPAAWGRLVLRNEQVDRIWRLKRTGNANGIGDGNGNGDPAGQRFEPVGFFPDGRQYLDHEWPLARCLASGERVSAEEVEIIRGDGTRGHISINAGPILDANGAIVAGVATFFDITVRKEAQSVARKQQAELIHLSRLSTMGQMAAGLAHELNQPLGAILNYAGVCLDRVNAKDRVDDKIVQALEEVAGETRRAGEIIRRLRGFARKEKPNVVPTAINHLVREAVAMVSAELHYAGVHVEFELCESLPAALADGVQIEQVVVNLVRNAIDAMRDTDANQRRLVVRTEPADDGRTARVSVIDAGCGVTPEVRARIFDSFFTTKPDGLGMGLPICQSIIQGHGGNLSLAANASGCGTVVEFTLPLAAQQDAPAHGAAQEQQEEALS